MAREIDVRKIAETLIGEMQQEAQRYLDAIEGVKALYGRIQEAVTRTQEASDGNIASGDTPPAGADSAPNTEAPGDPDPGTGTGPTEAH